MKSQCKMLRSSLIWPCQNKTEADKQASAQRGRRCHTQNTDAPARKSDAHLLEDDGKAVDHYEPARCGSKLRHFRHARNHNRSSPYSPKLYPQRRKGRGGQGCGVCVRRSRARAHRIGRALCEWFQKQGASWELIFDYQSRHLRRFPDLFLST